MTTHSCCFHRSKARSSPVTNGRTGAPACIRHSLLGGPCDNPAGQRTDALVQYADVLPTLVEAAGGKVDPNPFDGTSFMPVLRRESDHHRDYVYGVHNNVPEGPPYPIRSISNGTYRYIRNLSPDNLYIEKHVMGSEPSAAYRPQLLANMGLGRDLETTSLQPR